MSMSKYANTDAVRDIMSHLLDDTGMGAKTAPILRDPIAAYDAAVSLAREGVEGWEDVLLLDELSGGARGDFVALQAYLQGLGLPTVVSGKLVSHIRSRR